MYMLYMYTHYTVIIIYIHVHVHVHNINVHVHLPMYMYIYNTVHVHVHNINITCTCTLTNYCLHNSTCILYVFFLQIAVLPSNIKEVSGHVNPVLNNYLVNVFTGFFLGRTVSLWQQSDTTTS